MRNNIIKFGDVYVKQISGTGMGKPPAPSWANCVEGIHELATLPKYSSVVTFYKRYIDDVFGVWLPPDGCTKDIDDRLWTDFQAEVNSKCLTWEFSARQMKAQFLNIDFQIESSGKISTRTFEKPMALHLFIPPHSAHPPGVRTGHIMGSVLRIFRLSTYEKDITDDVVRLYRRFINRGHPADELQPLFLKAISNAREYIATSDAQRRLRLQAKNKATDRRLYLHVEFHDEHPAGHRLQQLFQETLFHPPGGVPLNEIEAFSGSQIPIDAMVIANHRARNIGDIFSYRDISKHVGPPTSSFI